MKNTCSKSKRTHNEINATAPDVLASKPWITVDDLTGDIQRMSGILVTPYVDDSNPLMHRDELQAECLATLAGILHARHLHRCPTRAKAFGFIKTESVLAGGYLSALSCPAGCSNIGCEKADEPQNHIRRDSLTSSPVAVGH